MEDLLVDADRRLREEGIADDDVVPRGVQVLR
jgi:hypothetical protein